MDRPGLGVETRAAAAAAGGVRVSEREARPLHRRDVVDLDAVQIGKAEAVDKQLDPLGVVNQVILRRRFLDVQAVFETRTSAGHHADAEPALLDRDLFGLHEFEDFFGGLSCQVNGDAIQLRSFGGAHEYLLKSYIIYTPQQDICQGVNIILWCVVLL